MDALCLRRRCETVGHLTWRLVVTKTKGKPRTLQILRNRNATGDSGVPGRILGVHNSRLHLLAQKTAVVLIESERQWLTICWPDITFENCMPDSSAHTHMHYNKRPRIHLGRRVDKQAVNTYKHLAPTCIWLSLTPCDKVSHVHCRPAAFGNRAGAERHSLLDPAIESYLHAVCVCRIRCMLSQQLPDRLGSLGSPGDA